MPLTVAVVLVVALIGVVFVAIGRDPGPPSWEVALAYEQAWDRLDFSVLYDLSGSELRDGLPRDAFVAAKRAAYARAAERQLHARVSVESTAAAGDTAHVVTSVESAEGGAVHNDVVLERRSGTWFVTGYSLRRTP